MQMQYVQLSDFMSTFYRDVKTQVEEQDIVEWAVEALRRIKAAPSFEEHVSYIEVRDHKAPIPEALTHIIQLARNTCYEESPGTACAEYVAQAYSSCTIASQEDVVPQPRILDCNGTPLEGWEYAYYRPYIDTKFDYIGWVDSALYRRCYVPIRPSTHTFMLANVCQENIPRITELYNTTQDEYTVKWPYFVFSFKTGFVAVSYRKLKMGQDGYPMIPDDPMWTNAITSFVRWKIAQQRFDMDMSPLNRSNVDYTWSVWDRAAGQAAAVAMAHVGADELEGLQNMHDYLLPRLNQSASFYGNLYNPEQRNWTDYMYRQNEHKW